ncbi:MAG: DUF4845 domain-containing protein [Gammaproteobacteria bacterium]|nr:DUF4845 domain-containing protein [Gammaproteobacteria bacterium]
MRNSTTTAGFSARQKQAGMTGIGIIFVLLMIGFFTLIALKLFPIYMESFEVNSALDSIKSESGLASKPSGKIVKSLMKKLKVDDVESVTKKEISIEKSKSGAIVYVDYEVVKPLFGNISILVSFEKQVELSR